MKKLLFVNLVLALLISRASLVQASEVKTNYQVLVDAFNSTSTPAALSDFPATPGLRLCDLISSDDPDFFDRIGFAVTQKIITPGVPEVNIPDNGPLLPGKHSPAIPAVTQVALYAQWFGFPYDNLFTLINSPNALEVVAGTNRILIRKKDGYFPFVIERDYGNGIPAILASGYCY